MVEDSRPLGVAGRGGGDEASGRDEDDEDEGDDGCGEVGQTWGHDGLGVALHNMEHDTDQDSHDGG